MEVLYQDLPVKDKEDIKLVSDQLLQWYIDLFIEFKAANSKMFCWLLEEKLNRAEREISIQGQLMLWT